MKLHAVAPGGPPEGHAGKVDDTVPEQEEIYVEVLLMGEMQSLLSSCLGHS